ncbi:ectonucleoside triphosphate diphosphohydrolase 5-like isoform X2 [Ctenocephalides felis]|uniref:ectonucleoside triphosphate diphosphohydrolase 5-like isoform X2 n=1 Tax=Ctenocephalides felis TaxID=7515 RepID=UPI000E6E2219|nr:ectonucleoside triphosphate diphosphohydrolase 5-like isoform X2 [Ctenocephalides felis]
MQEILLDIIVLTGFYSGSEVKKDLPNAGQEKNGKIVYILVIDAGSTGSRVVAYKFSKTGRDLQLLEEKFVKIRPGLSSYAHDPELGAQKIYELVQEVKDFVPKDDKPKTEVYLRATAGLRLLGDEKSAELLQVVQNALECTGYKAPKDAAAMLTGVEEGLFSWFTVNYFKHSLKKHHTYATLEMGGGSSQVTYEVNRPYVPYVRNSIYDSPKPNIKVFAHSYLGLGLSAARQGILQFDYPHPLHNNSHVTSVCYDRFTPYKNFTFNNMVLHVRGKPRSNKQIGVDIKKCRKRVLRFVRDKIVPVPYGLHEEANVALSAFYYRGKSGNVITDEYGVTTIGRIWKKLQLVCRYPNSKEPFLCLDLIYIHTLLTKGFRLHNSNIVEMLNSYDNHELSWALGFAYSKIMKTMPPATPVLDMREKSKKKVQCSTYKSKVKTEPILAKTEPTPASPVPTVNPDPTKPTVPK